MSPSIILQALQELRLFERVGPGASDVVNVPDETWSEAIKAVTGDGGVVVRIDRTLKQPQFVNEAGGGDETIVDLTQAALMAGIGADIWTSPESLLALPEPKSRYAILCTARSGSTWLCTQLQRVPGLGQPREHLRPPMMYLWENASELGFDRQFWIAGLERMASADGTFGTKVIEEFARPLGRSTSGAEKNDLIGRAQSYKWLHLERKDKVAQAVSRYIAEATDHWHVRAGDDPEKYQQKKTAIAYDGERIAYHLKNLHDGDEAIGRFLSTPALKSLRLFYEDVMAEPDTTILRAADFLVSDHSGANEGQFLSQTSTKSVLPISDEINRQFIEEFRATHII